MGRTSTSYAMRKVKFAVKKLTDAEVSRCLTGEDFGVEKAKAYLTFRLRKLVEAARYDGSKW